LFNLSTQTVAAKEWKNKGKLELEWQGNGFLLTFSDVIFMKSISHGSIKSYVNLFK